MIKTCVSDKDILKLIETIQSFNLPFDVIEHNYYYKENFNDRVYVSYFEIYKNKEIVRLMQNDKPSTYAYLRGIIDITTRYIT